MRCVGAVLECLKVAGKRKAEIKKMTAEDTRETGRDRQIMTHRMDKKIKRHHNGRHVKIVIPL